MAPQGNTQKVIPGLVPGIQATASAGAIGEMDPGDPDLRRAGKHRDDD